MQTVYLDWNILIDIFEKNGDGVFIYKLISDKIIAMPYSQAHISDIRLRKNNPILESQRIKELASLTSLYIEYTNDGKPVYSTRDPLEHYKTVSSSTFADYAMSELYNTVDLKGLKELGKKLQIDPSHINNFTAARLFDYLDEKFRPIFHMKAINGTYIHGFKDFIKLNLSFNPGIKTVAMECSILMVMLHALGYWSETVDKVECVSNDTLHAYFSTFCGVFVTNDRRLLEKSKVLTYYLEKDTKVFNSNDFVFSYNSLTKK